MLAAAKTRLINKRNVTHPVHFTLTFRRTTPRTVLNEISSKYARYIAHDTKGSETDEDYIRVVESDWYKEMSKSMTPAKYLKTLREASGHTLSELGEMLGVSAARVCDFESGRREISKAVAKKLSKIFLVPAEKFI